VTSLLSRSVSLTHCVSLDVQWQCIREAQSLCVTVYHIQPVTVCHYIRDSQSLCVTVSYTTSHGVSLCIIYNQSLCVTISERLSHCVSLYHIQPVTVCHYVRDSHHCVSLNVVKGVTMYNRHPVTVCYSVSLGIKSLCIKDAQSHCVTVYHTQLVTVCYCVSVTLSLSVAVCHTVTLSRGFTQWRTALVSWLCTVSLCYNDTK